MSDDRYEEGNREPDECRHCGQPIWIVYHGPHSNHTVEPRSLVELPDDAVITGTMEMISYIRPDDGELMYALRFVGENNYSSQIGLLNMAAFDLLMNRDSQSE